MRFATALSVLLSAAALTSCHSLPDDISTPGMSIVAEPATPGASGLQWRTLRTPDGVVQIAIARPKGPGPFPAVILLHGTHGFAQEYVQLARDLSEGGVIAIAACWFAPGSGEGMRAITPVACPEQTPAQTPNLSAESIRTVDAIIRATRALPNVRRSQVALFGHSRGAGTALNYALQTGGADALILNSAGYPEEFSASATRLSAPVLILHGTADSSVDGGSPFTAVGMARAFESAMLLAGKQVEAHYYPNGLHTGIFVDRAQREDELKRAQAFLRKRFPT